MLTAENIAARRTGIGASEIAAVLGISPWRSRLQLWTEKVHGEEAQDPTPDTERGDVLEGALVDWVAKRLDKGGLIVVPNHTLARHPAYWWAICTPDGYACDGTGVRVATVEVKAPRRATGWTHPDVDPAGYPLHYGVQVQWQAFVCGVPRGYIGALIHGELWLYEIAADPEAQRILLDAGREFWRSVEAREVPDVSDGDTAADLARITPQRTTGLVRVGAEEVDAMSTALRDLFRWQIAEKTAKANGERIKAAICQRIGDSEGIDLGDGVTATWRQARTSRRVDWEALARSLGATEDQIAEHTREVAGSRRFLVRGMEVE